MPKVKYALDTLALVLFSTIFHDGRVVSATEPFWSDVDLAPPSPVIQAREQQQQFDRGMPGEVADGVYMQSGDGIYKDSALRDVEHIEHSSLWGHKYMGGGAGEGTQFLSPTGMFPNKQEVKTDAVLPAYCDPPNPCPPGASADDGCLEEFENTAEFSRHYQANQDCLCDEDHMFACPAHRRKTPDSSSADTPELEFQSFLDSILSKADIKDQHKNLVAKKFHEKKRRSKRSVPAGASGTKIRETKSNETDDNKPTNKNPYLHGQVLTHIVAKKG